jgi:hypothetical protein
MMQGLANGIKNGLVAAKLAMAAVINDMGSTITSRIPEFQTGGQTLMTRFVFGLASRKNAARATMLASTVSAAAAIRSQYAGFSGAGSYLVDGFARGIELRTWVAKLKARNMAKDAEDAAREELRVKSPSKVFMEIGMYVAEGFAGGIEKYSGLVDGAVVDMADSAIDSVGNTISRLASAIETDIDSQPTIRPVLDLSDVRSGAATIGSLFDTNSQVGVMANVGTVSTMMRGYGQNGGSDDIVNAIDKLRKDFSNMSGDSYSVGNITYDDGSNIADAVKNLARAAKMERRI